MCLLQYKHYPKGTKICFSLVFRYIFLFQQTNTLKMERKNIILLRPQKTPD